MLPKTIIFAFGLMLLIFMPVPGSAAVTGKNVLFILDSSGSMAQRLGKQTKMQAAKKAFSDLINGIPAGTYVGLEVYGHYGDKDCSVIDVLVPPGPIDPGRILAAVAILKPQFGATPIAESLRKGAEVLKSVEGSKTIVLISDGEETCDGDPVAVARQIRDEIGAAFVVHVVGFDVAEKERQQLSGIAEAGGGSYYDAKTVVALAAGLKEIKEKVVEVAATPAPAPPLAVEVEVFRETFDGPALNPAWDHRNPNLDAHLLEDGKLLMITTPPLPSGDKPDDLLLYGGDMPKDYVVTTKFSRSIERYGLTDSTSWASLILYQDKNNMLFLRVGGLCCSDRRHAGFYKRGRGKWVPDLSLKLGGPDTELHQYDLKIEKSGRKFTGFVSVDGSGWKKVGTHTVIRSKYQPGIDVNRGGSAPEDEVEFEEFVIRTR